MVSSCAECICGVESNGGMRGCGADGGVKCATGGKCGPYQITRSYFDQCKTGTLHNIKTAFKACATSKTCARRCVENYLNLHGSQCQATTCKKMFQLHRNGPTKCTGKAVTRKQARALAKCCQTPGELCSPLDHMLLEWIECDGNLAQRQTLNRSVCIYVR